MVAYNFKHRFINPIRVGLGLLPIYQVGKKILAPDVDVEIRPKRQTIRAPGKNPGRHAKPGAIVQLYYAMRTKQCLKMGDAVCVSFEGVLLKWSDWPGHFTYDVGQREPGVWRRRGDLRPIDDLEKFARDDGFRDFDDMKAFWMDEHGPQTFEGFLIKWKPVSQALLESADD